MSEVYFSAGEESEGLNELGKLLETFEEETGTELPFNRLEREWRYDGASVYAAVNDHEAFYRLNGGGQNSDDLKVIAFLGQYLREAGYEEIEAELNGAWEELR